MDDRFCPNCGNPLIIKSDEAYSYDPILLVEEISYLCPTCGHESKIEQLKVMQ